MSDENGANTNNVKEDGNNSKPNAGKKRGRGGDGSGDVCRDYLNGICSRGSRCRFKHPENEDAGNQGENTQYNFCIDYQNRGCMRESCRFVHANPEDVERYKSKGIVSLPLARAIAATLTINDSINGIPICKEFQTGSCSRMNRCRYWHVDVECEKNARTQIRGRPGYPLPPAYTPGMRGPPPADYDPYGPSPAKRGYPGHMPAMGMEPGNPYLTSLERRNAELEKDNEALRRELEREKTRYEDLLAVFRSQNVPSQHAPAPVPPPMPSHQHPYGSYPHHQSWN